MGPTPTRTLGMCLSCNFVNVYTIAYQYTYTRVHARIPNRLPREDPRMEKRACRSSRRACPARGKLNGELAARRGTPTSRGCPCRCRSHGIEAIAQSVDCHRHQREAWPPCPRIVVSQYNARLPLTSLYSNIFARTAVGGQVCTTVRPRTYRQWFPQHSVDHSRCQSVQTPDRQTDTHHLLAAAAAAVAAADRINISEMT